MLSSIPAVAAVLLTPAVVGFALWLWFCHTIDKRHSPDDAAKVIAATGRWFPMRLRSAKQMEQTTEPTPLPSGRAVEETS